jgi:hypothetical protein
MNRIVTGTLVVWGILLGVGTATAQSVDPATSAYYRAASQAFRIPESEVLILAEWGLQADELPVILFVARLTRISPDAVVAMRRDRESWQAILGRQSIGPGRLHIEFTGNPPAALAAEYRQFASLPRERWGEVQLPDDAVIFLVNVRFLADHVGVDPETVAAARAQSASFPQAYRVLLGG